MMATITQCSHDPFTYGKPACHAANAVIVDSTEINVKPVKYSHTAFRVHAPAFPLL